MNDWWIRRKALGQAGEPHEEPDPIDRFGFGFATPGGAA